MRPIRLKLEGFAGIASGRGKPVIEINLDNIKDASVVAFAGPNGAGKTTVMDNLHPYRVMPSRASAPNPNSFSFYDQLVEGVDGLKELDWEHEGVAYRSVIRMKAAGKTKKQEAYLFQQRDGEFKPYQDDTGLSSDGKADTYDRAVEAVIGKPEVFFSTQFSAQGKLPISTMSAGEVKTLMASMLNMGDLRALATKATDVVKGLKPHLSSLQAQAVPLEQKKASAIGLENKCAEIQAAILIAGARLELEKSSAREKLSKYTALEVLSGQQEQVKAQRSALAGQLASVVEENAKQLTTFVAKQSVDALQVQTQLAASKQAVRVAESAVASAKSKVDEAQTLIKRETGVAAAKREREILTGKLSASRLEADNLFLDANRLSELQSAVASLRDAFTTNRAGGLNLKAIIDAAKVTASLINEVPCRGHSFAGSCQLLAQARSAESGLATQVVQLEGFRDRCSTSKAKLESSSSELDRLVESDKKSRALAVQISALEVGIANAKALMADAPRIELAKVTLPELNQVLAGSQLDLSAAKATLELATTAERVLKTVQGEAVQSFQGLLNNEVSRIQLALTNIPAIVGDGDLKTSGQEVALADQAVALIEANREGLRDQLRDIQSSLTGLDDINDQLAHMAASGDAISQEIAHWTLLNRALGNDGIIAMSIDDAGPSISALCNSLLEDCYGGRFVVRISTQAATATGVLKESFLIHVEDTLRGEQKLLDDMSGGEKVWINECLVRAMALYMTQASGSKFKTLFSDESDGPLDPERKRQFMTMKRAVLERGGYDREYLITQTPELLAMCDAVIDVAQL